MRHSSAIIISVIGLTLGGCIMPGESDRLTHTRQASPIDIRSPRAMTPSAPLDCAGPHAFPTETAQLIWPALVSVQPDRVDPGQEVEIRGTGGHLYWDGACGKLWMEAARDFQLFFDGKPVGFIQCYGGSCRADLAVPSGTSLGVHPISVEGGSSLDLWVK